jgi:hypothetical protein
MVFTYGSQKTPGLSRGHAAWELKDQAVPAPHEFVARVRDRPAVDLPGSGGSFERGWGSSKIG